MKAVIFNNNNALILDILDYTQDGPTNFINLKLTVNPVITIKADTAKTIIVDTDDLYSQKDIALTIAESLVGENGKIIQYIPETKKQEKKIIKKIVKNRTD